ncbi:uncharacterized protein CC84DRAFT_1251168 [Paraphaeosphaeria sporulosa]|uniref:DUF7708 domain-containing protein n=1 Tax=Paraphaeosphaeria sporulosa TaxID=1460663 RepID=A0A177C8Q3_9PLEO|nr:uncharacterized protein CC84DRAFT_1251168 [Paraphaeosphaeria sporulosa]OAG03090.1 hypothetical protein CC84DRAFT_1251168 [Paraphaeosphaeria sporulosa]
MARLPEIELKEDQLEFKKYEPTIAGVLGMVADVEKTCRVRGKKGREGKRWASFIDCAMTIIIKLSPQSSSTSPAARRKWCVFRTEEMQRAIADLYAHIFLFLNDTLTFFTKKHCRLLFDSMNDKFLQVFNAEIENIVRMSERIKRKATQMSKAEQRFTRLTLEESSKDLRLGLEGIWNDNAEMKYYALQFADRRIKLLTDTAQSNIESIPALAIEGGSSSDKRRSTIRSVSGEDAMVSRDQLLLATTCG